MDGATIRDIRRRLGITQRELAERLNVDQGTVSRWERDVESPRPAKQAMLLAVLTRDEERRHLNRCVALVRHDLRPATLLDAGLRLLMVSRSADEFFRGRGQDSSKLLGMSFDRYVDRIGCPALNDYLAESGFVKGDALLFRFTINSRGKGNTTVWEPIVEDGELVGVLNYVSSVHSFPDNDELSLERVDFVPADDPACLTKLFCGPRGGLIGNGGPGG